jgi:hypothetical protein
VVERSAWVLGAALAVLAACAFELAQVDTVEPPRDAGVSDTGDGESRWPPVGDGATDAGAGADASGAADAKLDARTEADAEAGPPLPSPDPGTVGCEGGTCTTGATRCCRDNSGTRCVATSTSICLGSEINCDETADCGGGSCCLGPNTNFASVPSTYCRTACATGYARVCKSSAECGTSACLAINCRGRAFGTCGGVQPQQCL